MNRGFQRRWLPILMVLAGSMPASAVPRGQDIPERSPCEDLERLGSEFMEYELAGGRWQGGDSACLSKLRMKTVRAIKADGPADPALLDPEYLLLKKRKMGIRTRRLPQDLLELRISYLGRKLGKDEQVEDDLTLKLNFGPARTEKGCATLHRPPKHFVMREGCSED
jgi:hypothetical protein